MGFIAFLGFISMILGIVGTVMYYSSAIGNKNSTLFPAMSSSVAFIGFFVLTTCLVMK